MSQNADNLIQAKSMNVVLLCFISAQIRRKLVKVSEPGSCSDRTTKNPKEIL